jgi:hypothetical protein
MSFKKFVFCFLVLSFLVLAAQVCPAQEAQVPIQVKPPEAYVFLDGVAVGRDNATLTMSPGKHTIGVYNYGFVPQIKQINAKPGMNDMIQTFLEPDPRGNVSGPWGVLQIKGADNAAILLNGKTPEFFVAHGDMVNTHLWFKQQLLLKPGTYDVLVTERGKDLFSGPITINRNERVILYVDQGGKQVVKSFSEGTGMGPQQRFKAGAATATVAIAPVSGTFSATPKKINCNDTVKLSWKTEETLHAYLTAEPGGTEEVPVTGEKEFQPKVTTKYTLRAPGPGGVVLQSIVVPVNKTIQAYMKTADESAHFVRVGDKILTQDSALFNWSVDNADKITIDQIGSVPAVPAKLTEGQRSFALTPVQTGPGLVDEKQVFKLTATNVCGGFDETTAAVHLVGDIEPIISSVFFPTAFPKAEHPRIGLLHSQEMQLVPLARAFKIYMEHAPDAKIVLIGNADPRGGKSNLKLSQRRAEEVRAFLLDMGVPYDKIVIQAQGSKQVLDKNTVKMLDAQNPSQPPAARAKNAKATWLAYNRRVDVVVMPAAVESVKIFPHDAKGSALIFNQNLQNSRKVEDNQ